MKIVIDIPNDMIEALEQGSFSAKYNMYDLVGCVMNGILLDHVFKTITDGIKEEADYSYADFEQYKADILDAEADELPDDDFRYGMERAIEIINAYRKAVDE